MAWAEVGGKTCSRTPWLGGATWEPRGPRVGPGLLPGALTPAMLPRAGLILAVCPVEEVGTGAKDLPVESEQTFHRRRNTKRPQAGAEMVRLANNWEMPTCCPWIPVVQGP